MIVLYWMTAEPIVVREETSLLEVLKLSRANRVRRFPVVRGDGELCGIIARTDLYRRIPHRLEGDHIPPEVEAELASNTVGDLMIKEPVTCNAYDHVENAARTMCEARVGAMPVLNRGHLVGIISEIDLLRALAELSFQGGEGKRITLRIPTEPESHEILYKVVDLCSRFHLKLLTILTHKVLDDSKVVVTLRVAGEHLDDFVQALWDEGYRVVEVE